MTPEQFLLFADPLPEPMLLLSGDGSILAGNHAVEEQLELALQEIRGKNLTEIASDPPVEVAHYLRACSRSRKLVFGALHLLGKSNQRKACRAEGALLRARSDSSGAILLMRLIPKESAVGQFVALNQRIDDLGREIRHRKQAEKALQEEKELLRVTLHSIGDAVIATDVEGRVISMNPIAESLTGWLQSEAQGKSLTSIFNIINETTRNPVDNPALRTLGLGTIIGLANHTLLIDKNGIERPIDDSAAPIRDQDGRVIGAVLVFHDITERKKAESQLRKLAADLSEANHRKDEFLATLAHELRNPLAPIRNSLQILRLSGSNREAVEKAQTIMERQLALMVRLVDDLLDVSRISRGKIELLKERIELTQVINGAIETSRPMIDAKNHQLIVQLPAEKIFLDADPMRMGQVFANLLNNSAKYSERAGSILLTAERQDSEVVVTVKDNGIGIPAHMLSQIFDLFIQVDRSLEKAQGGLGIGLTLVKRLVEMHGGSVAVRSEGRGQGSEFTVRLPIVLSPKPNGPTGDIDVSAAPVSSLRLLIADDNEDSAATLALMLSFMNHEVRTANNGLEAVQEAEAFRPHVIFLDIGMPILNGYEACRRIREEHWGKKIILIALTGWGQPEDKRRSNEAGFDHHFVKPVAPATLEKLLAELTAK